MKEETVPSTVTIISIVMKGFLNHHLADERFSFIKIDWFESSKEMCNGSLFTNLSRIIKNDYVSIPLKRSTIFITFNWSRQLFVTVGGTIINHSFVFGLVTF